MIKWYNSGFESFRTVKPAIQYFLSKHWIYILLAVILLLLIFFFIPNEEGRYSSDDQASMEKKSAVVTAWTIGIVFGALFDWEGLFDFKNDELVMFNGPLVSGDKGPIHVVETLIVSFSKGMLGYNYDPVVTDVRPEKK